MKSLTKKLQSIKKNQVKKSPPASGSVDLIEFQTSTAIFGIGVGIGIESKKNDVTFCRTVTSKVQFLINAEKNFTIPITTLKGYG